MLFVENKKDEEKLNPGEGASSAILEVHFEDNDLYGGGYLLLGMVVSTQDACATFLSQSLAYRNAKRCIYTTNKDGRIR